MVERRTRPIVPVEHTNEREHRRLLADRANASLPKDGTEGMSAPLALASYTAAELPDPSLWTGAVVFVSDEGVTAVSDGLAWERIGVGTGRIRVFLNFNQIVGGPSFFQIEFDTESEDSSDWFDNVTNFRYTPQSPGIYLVIVGVKTDGVDADGAQALIYKNGAVMHSGSYSAANGSADSFSQCSGLVQMDGVSDYIEGWAWCPSGRIRPGEEATYMHIQKIGA